MSINYLTTLQSSCKLEASNQKEGNMKGTKKLLIQEKPNSLDNIHITPHQTYDNVIVIYDLYTPLGYVEFEETQTTLHWAIPYKGSYATCYAELPLTKYSDFTLHDALPLVEKLLKPQ